jgi:hypothetical protein
VNGEVDINGTPTGTLASRVNQLNIGTEGVFNLGNNALIVDYDPASSSPRADIRSKILGQQIIGIGDFDSAPTIDAGRLAVGYGEAASLLGPSGGTFLDQPVDGSAVLIRYTIRGDTNLDGEVTFADLVAVAQHYGLTGAAEWTDGDVNLDGEVDFADLVNIAQNYGSTLAPGAIPGAAAGFDRDVAAAFAAVPEPGELCLLGMGSWLWFGRRRRRIVVDILKAHGRQGGRHA